MIGHVVNAPRDNDPRYQQPQGQYPPQQQYQQYPPDQYSQGQPHPPQQDPRGYGPPPAAPKKSRKWPWILLGMLLVPILGFGACVAVIGGAASSVSGDAATVVYEVSGAESAGKITYSANGSAGIAQENGVALPWTTEVQFDAGALRVATLTAQNSGSGDITCRITVNGEVVAELTSSGEFAVVSCNSEAF